MQGNKTVGLVIAMVVGLVIGGGVVYAMNSMEHMGEDKSGESSMQHSMANAALQTKLSNALTQHVSLAAPALRSVFDGDADTKAVVGALNQNTEEVVGLIGAVYGNEAKQAFGDLWKSHIGFFVDYTKAAKAGDQAAMDKALANLDNYSQEVSKLLAGANPNLDQATLEKGFSKHLNQVIAAVNAYGAGDYEKSYQKQLAAEQHMRGVATLLANAISKQFPDKL